MKDSKTASRYAKALLSLSQESGKLEDVYGNIQSLSATLADSSDLRSLIKNPTIKEKFRLNIFNRK